MAGLSRICPWWLAPTLDNPIRRLVHNPEKILGRLIEEGDTVLDLGCGSGTFTIAMAKMAGEDGRVIAVDLQDRMLQLLRKKAAKEGLSSRITTHRGEPDGIGIPEGSAILGRVDFALAFYMVHEVADQGAFLREVASLLKEDAGLLIVEPKLHVSKSAFRRMKEAAAGAGLMEIYEPKIWFSRSVLFRQG